MNRDETDVLTVLERMGDLMASGDNRLLAEFSKAPDVRVVGSELNEVARGGQEVESLIRAIFDQPTKFQWAWRQREASVVGDVAWVFAEGEIVYSGPSVSQRSPYRLTVVMVREDEQWRCRHFHGSEPARHSEPAA